MKIKCKSCNQLYHKDYILIIGPYWYSGNKNKAMCSNCFGKLYKKINKNLSKLHIK